MRAFSANPVPLGYTASFLTPNPLYESRVRSGMTLPFFSSTGGIPRTLSQQNSG